MTIRIWRSATFRRALMYGTNRQDILAGELLEGLESDGCRVLSGPFPAGLAQNDPLGYAYDQSIEPRPYEPPLARLCGGNECEPDESGC